MKFYLVDVFAEQKYQGNQLAVLVPDRELSAEEMQQIARETNFSETTFILSGKQPNGGYDVRIFTPGEEIPFAGHPTLGTAYVIHQLMEKGESSQVLLNLGVGEIPVYVDHHGYTMTQHQPSFGQTIEELDVVAEVLNIRTEDMRRDYPIQLVSTGLPCIVVPLVSPEAVTRCSINHDRFQQFIERIYKCNLLVFAPDEEADLKVRVFMDDPGFLEDPATGSANGNLAGYLLNHNYFQQDKVRYTVSQGREIHRPSLLRINAEKTEDTYRIEVGGHVYLVAEGEWH